MTDLELKTKIQDLEKAIEKWAIERDLWNDCSFVSYEEYFDNEPSDVTPTVTILCGDGAMFNMFNGFSYGEELEQFGEFMDSTGFYYEMHKPYAIEFLPANDELNQAYLDYFEWKWISKIIRPDYTSLYAEIFEYFDKNPHKLTDLHHRSFEILISEIFRNQGHRTILGKGKGDGGVDITLYKKDDIDQIPILVQVKKYKDSLPVKLEAVAALTGCVYAYEAKQGIFVTTSRYLPGVKDFAARKNSKIILTDTNDVRDWCKTAGSMIVKDRSLLTSDNQLLELVRMKQPTGLVGKVVVGGWGFDTTYNDFCIILKDTPHAALLMKIPSTPTYEDSPYNMIGYEIPLLNKEILKYRLKENFHRATKSITENGEMRFWTKDICYSLWDGKPQYFNHID